jgi:hypothetical protein
MEKNLKLSLSNDAKNSRKNARDFGVSVEIVKPRKDYHLIYENVGRELTLIDMESEIFFAFLSRRLRVRVVGWLIRSEYEKRARDMSQRVISIAEVSTNIEIVKKKMKLSVQKCPVSERQ